MIVYCSKDVEIILGVSRSKAYEIIRELTADLKAMGKMSPKAGSIQKTYFCERFMLDPAECDTVLIQNKTKEAV